MRVKFYGGEKSYECTEPIEQKLFRGGSACGWAVMFHVYGDADSTEIDGVITSEAISVLEFFDDKEPKNTFKITGYSAVTSCVIRHKAQITVTELQFTKSDVETGV